MPTNNPAAVSNTAIAFEKPITLQQGRALRDNPLAAFEASTGADYIAAGWHPHNGTAVGVGSAGAVYSGASLASFETPDFDDGYEYLLIFNEVGGTNIANLTIELYGATSASYGTAHNIVVGAQAVELTGEVHIVRPRMTANKAVIHAVVSNTAGDTTGAPLVIGDRRGTAQKRLRARIAVSAGTLNAGTVHMYRRRDFRT